MVWTELGLVYGIAGGYQDKVSLIVANYHLKLLHFMFTGS